MAPSSRKLPLNNIFAVFFDMDNTLIPTRRADNETCAKIQTILVEDHGVPEHEAVSITQTFLESFRRFNEKLDVDLDEWRETLWRQALGESYQNLAGDIYPQWLELRYHHLQPDAQVLAMLRDLKRRYFLALITNGFSRSQWEKIHRLGLQDYFNAIFVSGDELVNCEKPGKGIFYMACQELGIKPCEAIMVGDRLETDILGAQVAGLAASIWIPCAETKVSTTDVDYDDIITIEYVTELLQLLPSKTTTLPVLMDMLVPDSDNSCDFS